MRGIESSDEMAVRIDLEREWSDLWPRQDWQEFRDRLPKHYQSRVYYTIMRNITFIRSVLKVDLSQGPGSLRMIHDEVWLSFQHVGVKVLEQIRKCSGGYDHQPSKEVEDSRSDLAKAADQLSRVADALYAIAGAMMFGGKGKTA